MDASHDQYLDPKCRSRTTIYKCQMHNSTATPVSTTLHERSLLHEFFAYNQKLLVFQFLRASCLQSTLWKRNRPAATIEPATPKSSDVDHIISTIDSHVLQRHFHVNTHGCNATKSDVTLIDRARATSDLSPPCKLSLKPHNQFHVPPALLCTVPASKHTCTVQPSLTMVAFVANQYFACAKHAPQARRKAQ